MKLSVFERVAERKSDANKLRREGKIPAVLYAKGQSPRNIGVNNEEFQAILRAMKPGLLPTTVFELQEAGRVVRALVKEVQYQPATYAIQHIDFIELQEDVLVNVNVPIRIVGLVDSVGVKLGGMLRQVIRSLQVSCLPKDMPQEFVVDVTELNLGEKRTLADLSIPESVRPLAKLNEVVVVIAKKAAA